MVLSTTLWLGTQRYTEEHRDPQRSFSLCLSVILRVSQCNALVGDTEVLLMSCGDDKQRRPSHCDERSD